MEVATAISWKSRSAVIAGSALATGLTAVLGISCGKARQAPAPPLQVEVAPATQQDVPLVHEWIGTVDGFVNAEIRPQVEGYLLRQVYREGFPVKAGELLFQIDPRQFQAAANQARAGMARDQASLDKARLDVDRYTPLVAQKAISQQELDNALSAFKQAQANLEASQAAYEKAKLNLDWTRILSPISGIAGMAKVQVGDLVNGQKAMTTVSSVDQVKVYFNASEAEYMSWASAWSAKGGAKGSLQLILSDNSVYPHKGDPFMTDRNVDVKTGTIALAGLFPNPDHLLRPGQYAKVRAVLGIEKNAVMAPLRAVFEVQGQSQVAVVGADNKVDIRPVDLGPHVGALVVIEKGLGLQDKVVVEGVQKVSAGLLVKPVPAAR